jgi:hypothetical protein
MKELRERATVLVELEHDLLKGFTNSELHALWVDINNNPNYPFSSPYTDSVFEALWRVLKNNELPKEEA